MSYHKLMINLQGDNAEELSDMLMELDALSVSLHDAQDEPLFQVELQETPLWQEVSVEALFSQNTDIGHIIQYLQSHWQHDNPLTINQVTLEDEDWVRKTQQSFQPQCFADKVWVMPRWCEELPKQGTIIRIDPGLAFGTGTHATTALCLEWLATHDVAGKTVIDYGCGSGILSLAAIALGAKKVYAVDHDLQALEATNNNAALNECVNQNNLDVFLPSALPKVCAEVVIANILANPLVQLAPTINELVKPKGTLVLSGILDREIETVYRAYEKWFVLSDQATQEEWARIVLTRIN